MKRIIFIAMMVSLLFGVKVLYADLAYPYVVDQKNQVLFGDTAEVGDYKGLQNYTTNYVNGYLHVTYTYTHNSCCYASFPPALYISNLDPRSTSTPTIRSQQPVRPLVAWEPTDWYTYDIQFDATGYTVVVKQQATTTEFASVRQDIQGLTGTDWAALANAYPSTSNYSMAFTPLYIKKQPPEKIPVIIIPGIMGSYLNKDDGTEVWPNLTKMLLP